MPTPIQRVADRPTVKPNWPDACASDVGAANLGLHGIVGSSFASNI